jgi:hypothetical protein
MGKRYSVTDVKVGMRLFSSVGAEVVVVRVPSSPVELSCGGRPMTTESAATDPGDEQEPNTGIQLGKRYVDAESGIELLCTKSGPGELAADGRPLTVKAAHALPASD